MRKFLRITYYLSITAVFLLVAAAGFTQTKAFRAYLRSLILAEYPTVINGELHLGTLEGNLITGLVFSDLELRQAGTLVLAAERMEFRYDPFGIPFNKALISQVSLVRPQIFVFRSVEGEWNTSTLIRSAEEDSSSSPWTIDIKQVELQNAGVRIVDSLVLAERRGGFAAVPDTHRMDYADVSFDSVYVVAGIRVQRDGLVVQVHAASLESEHPAFRVKHLAGTLDMKPDRVQFSGGQLETDRSKARFTASIDHVNLATVSDIRDISENQLRADIVFERLDTHELQQILYPSLDFLSGSMAVRVKVNGTLQRLTVEHMEVSAGRTLVKAAGTITHIDEPDKLTLAVAFRDNIIHPQDLLDVLPGLRLPDLTSLGALTFSLGYEGTPNNFAAHLEGSLAAGAMNLTSHVVIEESNVSYSVNGTVAGFDPAILTENERLQGSIGARVQADGSGFDPRTMRAVVRVEVDSSEWMGFPVGRTVLVGNIADAVVRSRLSANIGRTNAELSGRVIVHRRAGASYVLDGSVHALNLATVLDDKDYNSDLSFGLHAGGEWGSASSRDTVSLRFLRSSFGEEEFYDGTLDVTQTVEASGTRSIGIASNIVDGLFVGRFTPATLVSSVVHGEEAVSAFVRYRIAALDSLRPFTRTSSVAVPWRMSSVGTNDSLHVRFDVNVKNGYALGIVLHESMDGQGTMQGVISGSLDSLAVQGSITTPVWAYGTGGTAVTIRDASVRYDLTGLQRERMPETMSAAIDLQATLLTVNALRMDDPVVSLTMDRDSGHVAVSALIDSTARVTAEGVSRFRLRMMEFDLARLRVEAGDYGFDNTEPVKITVGRDGMYVRPIVFAHEAEELALGGYFNPAGVSDMELVATSVLLSNLRSFLGKAGHGSEATRIAGIVNGRVVFRGTFAHPNIDMDLTADGLSVNTLVYGRVDMKAGYFERLLNLDLKYLRSDNSTGQPDLELAGTVPFDLALTSEPIPPLAGTIDLLLNMRDLNLRLLGPFIPEIASLTGTTNGEVTMKGTVDQPLYEGSLTMSNARFTFLPLGMEYILNGRFVPSGDRIQFADVTLRNVPGERFEGEMRLGGYFRMAGLSFVDFNLLANGELMVMKESSVQPGQKIYGNLFTATGPGGLTWQGDLDQSHVRGEVLIRNGQLILPPDRESAIPTRRTITVAFKDDTSRARLDEVHAAMGQQGRGFFLEGPDTRPDKTRREGQAVPTREDRSFLDGISYDLVLETGGPTQLRFIFDARTGEELFADLEGRMVFFKNPSVTRLTGEVRISERSYYNFFRRLSATGKLLFTGDPLNPELDINARYEGVYQKEDPLTSTTGTVEESSPPAAEGRMVEQKITVIVEIKGTRNEPKPKIYYLVDGVEDKTRGDTESNAVSYLLTGQFRDDLAGQGETNLLSPGLGIGLAASALTGPLSNILREQTRGVVQSLDVQYYGQKPADVRAALQFDEVVVRAGGSVDLINANVSVELPMSYVLNIDRLRNLILTVERRSEGIEGNNDQRRLTNGARVFYRFTF